jgi:hypothetical protein
MTDIRINGTITKETSMQIRKVSVSKRFYR